MKNRASVLFGREWTKWTDMDEMDSNIRERKEEILSVSVHPRPFLSILVHKNARCFFHEVALIVGLENLAD